MKRRNRTVALAGLIAALTLTIAAFALGQADPAAKTEETKAEAPKAAVDAAEKATSTWQTSLGEALKAAKEAKKPVFVDFYASWCPPCRMLLKTTFPDPKVQEALKDFVPTKIDVDKNQATAGEYGVTSIPVLVVLDENGKALARAGGYRTPDELLDFLAYGGAVHKMAANPKDADAAFVAADKNSVVELPMQVRQSLVKIALKLNEKAGPERRSRLLLLSAQLQMNAKGRDLAAIKKTLAAARKLDPDNAHGVREAVDWIMNIVALQETEDMAAFIAAAKEYVADHPIDKIRNKGLHLEALFSIFQSLEASGDLKGAIAILEQMKTHHLDRVNPAQVDDAIAKMKAAMGAAKEVVKKKPDDATKAPNDDAAHE